MKRLLAGLLLLPTAAIADIQVDLLQFDRLADEEAYQVGNWQGIQLSYDLNKDWYVFGSYEIAEIIPLWGIGKMNLLGAGVGIKYPITSRFSIFGQLGYYHVTQESEGYTEGFHEGLEYYFNDKYGFLTKDYGTPDAYYHFDGYQVEYEDTFAGTVGVQYAVPISDRTEVGFGISYRSMKITELFRAYRDEWDYANTGACWEQKINRNYSTINYSITFKAKF